MSDRWIYGFLGCFALAALAVPIVPIVLARWIAPKKRGEVKGQPYECGTEGWGDAWIQFRIRYYLFAILFVVFDVEALFLFPWAVIFQEAGWAGCAAIGLFVGIIGLGWVYAWQEGALDWVEEDRFDAKGRRPQNVGTG
jgi:NADH-quinone oxidoreductase subunit A